MTCSACSTRPATISSPWTASSIEPRGGSHTVFFPASRKPALKSYQDRIDDPARKLLAAAKRTNDTAPLWDLLDRYFVSRPADEGLLLLGDLLFERGEYRAAERMWQRLLPDGGADLVYPGSRLDPAVVRARIVLAIIYQNDLERAARDLIAFRKRHPARAAHSPGKPADSLTLSRAGSITHRRSHR